MKAIAFFRSLADALFHRSRFDRDLDDELRTHIQNRAADLARDGLSPAEALRRARLEFGALDKAKEQCREALGVHFLHALAQDLRYAARTLRKSPGFAAVAILTLALGIGATTAMFSIINTVLLQPMPFPDSPRLVKIDGTNLPAEDTKTLTDVSAYETGEMNFTGTGEPASVATAAVSQNFFRMLRVPPIAGRAFLPEEEAEKYPSAAILSYELWRSQCNSDPREIGKTIQLNGSAFTVVGIMPASFEFPARTRIWITMPPVLADLFGGNVVVTTDLARLRPGVTLDEAVAEIRVIQIRGIPKGTRPYSLASVTPLRETMISGIRPALLLLLGAAGLVLLIACANVANLVLARSTGRFREFAVRSAVGASRSRLIRQLLTESVLLSLIGGTLGVLTGIWAITLAKAALRAQGAGGIHLDVRVLLFACAVAVLAGIVTGLLPALQFSRPDLNGALKNNVPALRLATRQTSRHLFGNILSVAEIAAALVLLAGAGLLLRSFGKLLDVDPGYRTEHLVAAQLSLMGPAYSAPEARLSFFDSVLARARALPGVHDAALINALPLAPAAVAGFYLTPEGAPKDSRRAIALYMVVSPQYFQTMGIPLLAGRDFTAQERAPSATPDDSFRAYTPGLSQAVAGTAAATTWHSATPAARHPVPQVAIVSRSLASQMWPAENPLGRHFAVFDHTSVTVIGVAADVRSFGLDTPPSPLVYFPMFQQSLDAAYLVVHTSGDPAAMATALRGVASVDKTEPISTVTTMDDLVSHSVADARFRTVLLGVFAAVAFLLAVVGIYGVISYSVGQRTREIGIRIALGAGRLDILRMVLRGGLLLIAVGIAIGLAASLALAHLLTHFLFGVHPGDPGTLAAVALALFIVALVACYIPARRAMRVDPTTAMRCE